MSDDEYGLDLEFTSELQEVLYQAESQDDAQTYSSHRPIHEVLEQRSPSSEAAIEDIEDMLKLSPLDLFRKRGSLSVSDLVGTVWCEVQYDYRLRSKPFLPPSQRPATILSKSGKEIVLDKVKVEGKEKILKRGEKIHKKLEREIHPEEIVVVPETREDVWGIKILNMLVALEALISIGKCRELPVVGFVNDILIMGIIDEISREPVDRSSAKAIAERPTRQTSLTSFFPSDKKDVRKRTHKLYISDSKTRASGTLPRESDTLAGKLQVMMYKEMLDAMLELETTKDPNISIESPLPTAQPFSFDRVFAQLGLNPSEPFSQNFLAQSLPIIRGNGLGGVGNVSCLSDMSVSWRASVDRLGLGKSQSSSIAVDNAEILGRTEDRLQLVYRRAARGNRRSKRQTKTEQPRNSRSSSPTGTAQIADERAMQVAIKRSLRVSQSPTSSQDLPPDRAQRNDTGRSRRLSTRAVSPAATLSDIEREKEEDELALAVEMSLLDRHQALDAVEGEPVVVHSSQAEHFEAPDAKTKSFQTGMVEDTSTSGSSGSIIGRSTFRHDPVLLANHLDSVLAWWLGKREAVGVSPEETRRCGWCEFEADCEWRAGKAEEHLRRTRGRDSNAEVV